MSRKKILVFTGAGISKESGLSTFRDSKNGLWNDFNVEEVATIKGWNTDPQKVIDFYNMRKNELKSVNPNAAHLLIADLEKDFDVTVITQNVDDLHEKAGSSDIIHLHGSLTRLKSSIRETHKEPYNEDLKIGDLDPEGYQLRPDIVWFGEGLDFMDMHRAQIAAEEADVCIIIGTSMQVGPANEIPWMTPELALIYYVDPGERDFIVPKFRIRAGLFTHVKKSATGGLPEVIEELKRIYLK